jgi:hypothetical protein
MALTVSNRETFAVLDWMDCDPQRREYWRARAQKLSNLDTATAVPNLSNMIYEELSKEIPDLGGVAAELLKSGLFRVNFYELALALLLESGAPPPTDGQYRE